MTKKKIMIVEDEVIVGIDLKKKLQSLGYDVCSDIIRYGEDVFDAALKPHPDLLLMDIRLKGKMDGTQAAFMVQQKLDVSIVFLTAYSDQETILKAKSSQPYAYLKKPVQMEELKISLEISLYRAEMQKKLKTSEQLLRMVANFTYDWETWIGQDGSYIYTSPSCKRITGYSEKRFSEDPGFFYSIVHPDDQQEVKKRFKCHITSTKEECFLEFRIVRADKETRWIEHCCRPVYDPEGNYLGRRASNRDISKRKKLEFELEKKVSELQEALDNIKTLKGLIPICSKCKKIRDDKGYWNMLEAYIQKHSQAQFSHGMCPSCMDDCYGDEDWYREMKNKPV